MLRVCAWYGKKLGYRKGGARGDVTHGMCKACEAKNLALGYRKSGDKTLRWVGAETKKEGSKPPLPPEPLNLATASPVVKIWALNNSLNTILPWV